MYKVKILDMDIINEIRKRIKANSRDEYDGNDEYENGKAVGLAIALHIIDEVEKEHPVPSGVHEDKAATDYYLSLTNSSYGEGGYLLPRSINEAFKAGAEWQRNKPIPEDVQEAADSVAITKSMDYVDGIPDGGTREHPWNDHDVERGYQAGFRDGIGWERERKTQRVGEEWGDKVAENPEIIFSTDGELTVYSFVGAPRWWATIREAEEALSVFKAGAEWQAMKDGECHEESFEEGAKWQRERLMKEAVEGQVSAIDTARFIDIDQDICDKRLAERKDGDKVKLIIVKEAGK